MCQGWRSSRERQKGASAVEFALLLPLLVSVLLGIMEFGYLFNQQISLTQAAREGARSYAIHHGEAAFNLTKTAQDSAPSLSGITAIASGAGITGGACPSGSTVVVKTTITYSSLTGWFDAFLPTVLDGKVGMRCGG